VSSVVIEGSWGLTYTDDGDILNVILEARWLPVGGFLRHWDLGMR